MIILRISPEMNLESTEFLKIISDTANVVKHRKEKPAITNTQDRTITENKSRDLIKNFSDKISEDLLLKIKLILLLSIIIIFIINFYNNTSSRLYIKTSIILFSSFIILSGLILTGILPLYLIRWLLINIITAYIPFFLIKLIIGYSPINNNHKEFKIFLLLFAGIPVFSIITGIIINSFYIEEVYRKGLLPYSSVKLAYSMPFIIYILTDKERTIQRMIAQGAGLSAGKNQKKLNLIIPGLFLLIISVAIFRSGNSGNLLPGENTLRETFSGYLPVRPRFKEIFAGYPALLVIYLIKTNFPYLSRVKRILIGYLKEDDSNEITKINTEEKTDIYPNKQLKFLFYGAAIFLPVSIINSFCHFHTPVMISIIRTLTGTGIGVLTFAGVWLGSMIFLKKRVG